MSHSLTFADANRPRPDAEFTIADWPANSDTARRALQDMQSTHAVQPLPAFDVRGDLIPPADYDLALRGAVAHVHFTYSKFSWRAGDNHKDTFVADIDMIRVITPPRPCPRASPAHKRPLTIDVYTPQIGNAFKRCLL